MADHVLIAWCFGLFATLQLAVLVILGLQLRAAKRDSQRLAETMAQIDRGMDALVRRLASR
jgi:hypothetical protein